MHRQQESHGSCDTHQHAGDSLERAHRGRAQLRRALAHQSERNHRHGEHRNVLQGLDNRDLPEDIHCAAWRIRHASSKRPINKR
jgi:hypothetical protein